MKAILQISAMLMVFCMATLAQADPIPGTQNLYDRGGGLIYDSDRDITWLQTAYHQSLDWYQAGQWVENLVYYDSVRNTNWTDWRLPTALNPDGSGPCLGDNCAGSELGHLYYTELGNVVGPTSVNTGPFINLWDFFWFNEEDATNPSFAWDFSFFSLSGGQYTRLKDVGGYEISVLAVRDGDVASVPEPATILIFGFGLVVIAGFRIRMHE
jgi:hypothetical protein